MQRNIEIRSIVGRSPMIAPAEGETLAQDLKGAGEEILSYDVTDVSAALSRTFKRRAATMFYLAADAYRIAAAASMGHTRRDRYANAADELIAKADKLTAE